MMLPEWFWIVVQLATLIMLICCLDTLHAVRREQRRSKRQQDAPAVEAQDRPRVVEAA
jgi:hypothetical protein